MSRRSYSALTRMPAWLLLDADRNIVASVRALSAEDARVLFHDHGLSGAWLRRA